MTKATGDLRNLALVGHAGAGKTLLAEALLFGAGATRAKGSLVRGTTVSDHDPLVALTPWLFVFQATVTRSPGCQPPAGLTVISLTARSGYEASVEVRLRIALLFVSPVPAAFTSGTVPLPPAD